jgi:cell division protein FtsW
MKMALVIFVADLLARRADRVHEARMVVAPVVAILVVSGLLILKQPDMGTVLVLVCIGFGMLLVGGVPLRPMAKVVGVTGVLAFLVGVADPYRRDRILSFVHPFAHSQGSGYQVVQSLVGLGSGGFFGLGLGAGHEKWGLLPNPHTDFIFSVIGEETGLIGSLVVIGLFFAFAWVSLKIAAKTQDRFEGLIAVGIMCWILSQAVINIGAVIGLLPVTGIPLPFISFGGSSLVINMAAAGLLANVARRAEMAPRRLTAREASRRQAGRERRLVPMNVRSPAVPGRAGRR